MNTKSPLEKSEDYIPSKEERRRKLEKRKQRMKVSGAGVKKIPQLWKKRAGGKEE